MPQIDQESIGVAFDLQGCPNRCRHCWLGPASGKTLSEEEVRWGAQRFQQVAEARSFCFEKLTIATWFREPDYANQYQCLYALEAELSDGPPGRYELLSVWRLARDPGYAEWARSVGPDTCQISFFGLEETNDWFHRRPGAFEDALRATERLLEVGMKPRWQLFLTTRLLPELDALLALIDAHQLRERVGALGGEFQLFMHPPDPDYEGRKIEQFRPTAAQVAYLPEAILGPTRRHFGRDLLWHTEAELYDNILAASDEERQLDALPEVLWFFVCSNWDVYANVGTLEPWWCLGNLKRDSIESILGRFEADDNPGLQTLFHASPKQLAKEYGDPAGQRIYSDRGDLLSLYRGEHSEKMWNRK